VTKPARDSADVITAALLQITQQAERIATLDEREANHYRDIATRLADLARQVETTGERTSKMHATAARQAAILDSLDGLDREVASLASRITGMPNGRGGDDGNDEGYRPAPVPRWWKLRGAEREEALARLRAWVEQVYRPGYGHLAAALGPCWDQHPLCLYGLDWLMELWSVLYLPPERKTPAVASQAEWQTRLLPALAEQMYIETTRCQHVKPSAQRPVTSATWRNENGPRPGRRPDAAP
jgi:hypothetical protein